MSPEPPHPVITTFGDTQQHSFPLILCIGREPYTERRIENRVGSEPVSLIEGVDFWYVPHGVAACVNGQRPHEFLASCIERDASPIVIADVLHQGIRGGDTRRRRREIRDESPERISQNLANIFSHEAILHRIKLVVLAGLGRRFAAPFFDPYADRIQRMCGRLGIPTAPVPFFIHQNVFSILDVLNDKHRGIIRDVLSAFSSQWNR